jgi:pimeloyl-ACP methyl ester carboxylesterase
MSRWEDAAVREAAVPQGTIRYRELGTGEPVVLVHGLLTNGELWREVAPRLAQDLRVIVPDWPLGSHDLAMRDGTDFTLPGLAAIVAGFLDALELEGVTLVGNDTGGAVVQRVAVDHPARVGRVVLTPCDAFDNFLPPLFKPLQVAARVPGAVFAIGNSLRPRFARRLPLAFGWLAKRPLPDDMTDAFLAPLLRDRRIRKEVAALLRGVSKRYTQEAAARLGEFQRPVLIAWAPEDKVFPFEHAERLARAFPDARVERIEDSYTYVCADQPERTAQLIAQFAREPAPAPAA